MADFAKAHAKTSAHEAGYDPIVLERAIAAALLAENRAVAPQRTARCNERKYICVVDNCQNPGYAKGLCNAHYTRTRKARPLDLPLRNRFSAELCLKCGKVIGPHGGWRRCQKHYRYHRARIVKAAVLRVTGRQCARCLRSYPDCALDFHHLGNKVKAVSEIIRAGGSAARVSREITKCVVVCANCHRMEHDGEL